MKKIIIKEKLVQLWKDLLKLDRINSKQDFYELGGNSFLAIQLLFMIKKEIGVELLPSNLIKRPLTIQYLVGLVTSRTRRRLPQKKLINDIFYNDLKHSKYLQFVWRPYECKKIMAIFLTGANGFVGAHLLDSLLKNTNYTIYCLIHSSNEKLAWEKLQSALSFFGLSLPDHLRVKIVCGDLSQPYFALSRLQFNNLAQKIDVIIHCGAIVNFEMSYLDLKPVNINGTREILRLSATIKSKPVHYISSLAVLGIDHAKKINNVYYENNLNKFKPISAYAQTKFIAEKSIKFGIKRGLKANIYRLGEVAPSRTTGMPNPKALHHLFIKACKIIGFFPKSIVKIDYLPVDFVADFIIKIIILENKNLLGKVFHLCHPQGISFAKIFEYLARQGTKIKSLNGQNFLYSLECQSSSISAVATLKLFFGKQKKFNSNNLFEQFFLKEMRYISMENTKKIMKITKLTFPVLNSKTLAAYISYLRLDSKIYE